MTTLEEAAALTRPERGLVVISTLRSAGSIQSSLVNAGVLPHPATGQTILGFATAGRIKLANLRARPQITATFRNGWRWAAVEGLAELAGPDDPSHGLMPKVYGNSVARSSRLPEVSMTTGTNTTGSCPKNAGPPCSSDRNGSTATDGRPRSRSLATDPTDDDCFTVLTI